jgi:hypothetical protein
MRILPRVLSQWLWKKVALFAYRRWAEPDGRKPWGLPFNRDPDNPCSAYEPRKWKLGDWNDCQTDGHALCRECCRRSPTLDGGEETGAAVFSQRRATTIDRIDEWFYEFVADHIARHPRSDWPNGDFEQFRAFFGPWKATFVRLHIDREQADNASRMMTAESPLYLVEHLPALVRMTGKQHADVLDIRLWR